MKKTAHTTSGRGIERWTLAMITVFVVICSFCYGFVRTVRKPHVAAAALASVGSGEQQLFRRLVIPPGVILSPLGNKLQLNGAAAEAASFVSTRGARELLEAQVKRWESLGWKALGAVSANRGVAFALNPRSLERHVMTAGVVPEALRERVSAGYPVQGVLSVVQDGEERGEVPEIPLLPGGRASGVLSSLDPGGRAYSATYTNPGTIDENIDFYLGILSAEGWRETFKHAGRRGEAEFGSLAFRRGREEVQLLFSSAPSSSSPRTLVVVNRFYGGSES